jgi:hypothetical protein
MREREGERKQERIITREKEGIRKRKTKKESKRCRGKENETKECRKEKREWRRERVRGEKNKERITDRKGRNLKKPASEPETSP